MNGNIVSIFTALRVPRSVNANSRRDEGDISPNVP
jgi:hypothetical protein